MLVTLTLRTSKLFTHSLFVTIPLPFPLMPYLSMLLKSIICLLYQLHKVIDIKLYKLIDSRISVTNN